MVEGRYENYLTISGEGAFQSLKDCEGNMASYKQKDGTYNLIRQSRFTFNALVPVPQKVLDVGYASRQISPSLSLEDPFYGKLIKVPGSGKEWQQNNWGSSMDVDEDAVYPHTEHWETVFEGPEISEVAVEFSIEDTPPRQWVITCAKRYPNLEFKLSYINDISSCAGKLIITNGEVVSDITYFKANSNFNDFIEEEFGVSVSSISEEGSIIGANPDYGAVE